MKRISVLLYGVVSYSLGVSALVGWILTMLGIFPFQMKLAVYEPSSLVISLLIAIALTSVFAIQHTIMARDKFKKRFANVFPEAGQRSTFVLATGAILWSILILWPKDQTLIWSIENSILSTTITGLALLGWAYLFIASFAINHFELFGLEQVFRYFRKKDIVAVPFKERLMYKYDRHPIMTGALIGMWCTPHMTMDHLLFSCLFSIYIVFGVAVEEKDLIKNWGDGYLDYKKRVGSLVPTRSAN